MWLVSADGTRKGRGGLGSWNIGILGVAPTHVFIVGGLLRLDRSFNLSGLAVDQGIHRQANGPRRVVGSVSVNDGKEGC